MSYLSNSPTGGATTVESFNGRTGDVLPTTGDYTASQVTNVPAGNIAATDVQSALNELDTEKGNVSGALTQFIGNTAHRVFYSDLNGDVTELALGADGTFLKSNGATSAPTFAVPAGSGDVSKVGTPVNNQVGVWTGDGTIEGDVNLTFDTTTDTLATTNITATTVTAALVGNATTSTNTTGNAATVTTNANLTGPVTSTGNATAIADSALSIAKTSGLQAALDLKAPLASPTFTGTVVLGTSPTMTTPVITGLPTGTGVASAATASTIVARDVNANISFANWLAGYTTTATAAGTTTLTVASNNLQFFTGSTTQTVTLPVASTLTLGHQFEIVNNSTGLVTINSSGANAVIILAGGTSALLTCILASGTSAASWSYTYIGDVVATGKKLTVSNSLTLAGTDSTVMTFPTTSATIARTDAAQTFTGVQTFVAPILGTPTSATLTNATGLPISGLVASTSTAIGVGSVELGHATDTTLTRAAAGDLAVEGVSVLTTSNTKTVTGKRIQPRTASSTTSSNLSPDLSTANVYFRTTQTATLTIDAPTGTPVIGETIMIYVDSASAQTLTINATYVVFGVAFPATTTAGKTFMMSAQYNGTNWKTLWANAI